MAGRCKAIGQPINQQHGAQGGDDDAESVPSAPTPALAAADVDGMSHQQAKDHQRQLVLGCHAAPAIITRCPRSGDQVGIDGAEPRPKTCRSGDVVVRCLPEHQQLHAIHSSRAPTMLVQGILAALRQSIP
jgi:hypothetical protein